MQLPGPVRAVVGLLATAAGEAKSLPDRAIELPMLAVSTALQMSLRAQQRYARLAARGDQVMNRRPVSDDPPPWATFDEPVPAGELRPIRTDPAGGTSHARAASQLIDELLKMGDGLRGQSDEIDDEPSTRSTTTAPAAPNGARPSTTGKPAAKRAAAAKRTTKKAAADKAVSKATAKSAARKPGSVKRAPVNQAPVKPAPVNQAPVKPAPVNQAEAETGAKPKAGKTINKPRHTTPSRFDTVDDD
jgi:hypothetical protein